MLSIRKMFGPRPGAAQVRGLKKRKREGELPTKTEGEVRGATGARLSEAAAQLCRGPRCSRIWPGEGGCEGGKYVGRGEELRSSSAGRTSRKASPRRRRRGSP